MAPKTEFSVPLQKCVNVVTHSRRSNREVCTTEKGGSAEAPKEVLLAIWITQKGWGDCMSNQ